MKSLERGSGTSPEVTNISPHGFWVLFDGKEIFVPFAENQWFREASVAQISNVEAFGNGHLHWPDLDVDLSVKILENPEHYPLVSKGN